MSRILESSASFAFKTTTPAAQAATSRAAQAAQAAQAAAQAAQAARDQHQQPSYINGKVVDTSQLTHGHVLVFSGGADCWKAVPPYFSTKTIGGIPISALPFKDQETIAFDHGTRTFMPKLITDAKSINGVPIDHNRTANSTLRNGHSLVYNGDTHSWTYDHPHHHHHAPPPSSPSSQTLIVGAADHLGKAYTLPNPQTDDRIQPGHLIIIKDEEGTASEQHYIIIKTPPPNDNHPPIYIDKTQTELLLTTPFQCVTLYVNATQTGYHIV
jgi:type II secretory pathway pseudopilin PulG